MTGVALGLWYAMFQMLSHDLLLGENVDVAQQRTANLQIRRDGTRRLLHVEHRKRTPIPHRRHRRPRFAPDVAGKLHRRTNGRLSALSISPAYPLRQPFLHAALVQGKDQGK